MNRIPVDASALGDIRFVSTEPRTDREGKPVLRDGTPVQRASILVRPDDGKSEVIAVDVVRALPFTLGELARVRVMNLIARPWSIDGRDGVSFSADDIQPLSSPINKD